MTDVDTLREIGQMLRVDSVRVAGEAGSGHPTSSMSAADLMAVLVSKHLRYDFARADDPHNDHLIFSKGHASPLLYSIYRAVGAVTEEEFLTYRRFGSRLEGHPTPVLPWVDVATGSLGQGLANAIGVALAGKHLDRLPYRVWVLCGDSEMAEGSMWEAVEHAGFWKLDNLVAIVDVNRLGQRGATMYEWNLDAYADRIRAFGWHAITIDGHDIEQIDRAYDEAKRTTGRPTAIIAKTLKGKGVAAVENQQGWHGRALANTAEAVEELGGIRQIRVPVAPPERSTKPHVFATNGGSAPVYQAGEAVATRRAYGDALAALGSMRGDVVALDGETSNSTYSEFFGKAHPDRFFEAYISEQLMVAAAVGLQVRGWKPFASTFASFLSRAYDFIRMAAVSRASVRLVGSHAGVSIGEDGPSQMALEDLAMMRAVHGSTVLYPSDANQTVKLVEAMADREGIVYLRTSRPATKVIYGAGDPFPIGGSRVARSSSRDRVTVVGAGVTLHEALAAAERLAGEGIAVRVIDAYSVKPIDGATLAQAARETGTMITVEDHWPEGGLGDAVLEALAGAGVSARVRKLAVRSLPGSGTPAELLAAAGIDADHIASAARELAGAGAHA
ncbi:MAG: transketolase [Chloroflexi bacterium]|nr:transketolase [Chloroflexota bacterium]